MKQGVKYPAGKGGRLPPIEIGRDIYSILQKEINRHVAQNITVTKVEAKALLHSVLYGIQK